jgi:hypothetical protein
MRGESQRAVSAHKRDDATINGFTTDEAELPAKINGKEKLADPAIDPSLIEVLRYEFHGGPVAIHGKVFVHIKDNPRTTTQGTVRPGHVLKAW